MARRFFIPPGTCAGGTITVRGDLFRHMAQVLRLKPGARVVMVDGAGHEFDGTVQTIGQEELIVGIEETREVSDSGGFPRISLFQGLPKGDKMELVLQKAVELGATEIIPFTAKRSVARVLGREEEKLGRWRKIAREAARQSGRAAVPSVALAKDMAEVVEESRHTVKLMLWEKERESRLKETLARLPRPETIAVLVGPEGGLTDEEAELAARGGFIPVSLGDRILRTETAGLAILAILQFYWGDIG